MFSSYDLLNLTQLDILDSFEEIRVTTGYKIDGQELEIPPVDLNETTSMEIEYRAFEGRMCGTARIRDFGHLPDEAKAQRAAH